MLITNKRYNVSTRSLDRLINRWQKLKKKTLYILSLKRRQTQKYRRKINDRHRGSMIRFNTWYERKTKFRIWTEYLLGHRDLCRPLFISSVVYFVIIS